MKNKIILVAFIFAVFYLGGCLMHASFNVGSWSYRTYLFGICTGVALFALGMDYVIRDSKKDQ